MFGSRNVIIRFIHRKDAQKDLYRKRDIVLCKEIGYNHLYMSENLCPAFRSVYNDMNALKCAGKIGFVWVSNGSIKYKLQDIASENLKKYIISLMF